MAKEKQIAVVVYPGMTTLELVGTVSILNGIGLETGFRTVTVGEGREPVSPDTPLRLVPQSTFEEMDEPFGIVVPGAGPRAITAMGDENLLRYVRSVAETAELVGSVGTGALILAATGLLEGRRATTHPEYRILLENLGAIYVERRWIEDGRFITSGGASGGIDMALYLVAKHRNRRSARQVQLWVEYDPQPPFGPIDRSGVEREAMADVLVRHGVDPTHSLIHRPDLLEAVRGGIQRTTLVETGQRGRRIK